MDIVSLPAWEKILNDILKYKGLTIIIGPTDSGKTTLMNYFVHKLLSHNKIVSVVDSDIGQSTIGLPGTTSMKTFSSEVEKNDDTWDHLLYLGFVNPSKNIKMVVDSTSRLVNKAREVSEFIIVDTSGLISGTYGKILKTEKIKKIKPDFIIVIQRLDELKHIIDSFQDNNRKIYIISPSPYSKVRKRVERIKYRNNKLKNYFLNKPKNEYIVYKDSIQFFYYGKGIDISKVEICKNTIIGLNNSEYTLSLGVIEDFNTKSITFYSPIEDIKNIKKIILGDLKLGNEDINNGNTNFN